VSFVAAVVNGQIREMQDEDVDVEIQDTQGLFSPHLNSIPMPGAVMAPRSFYGARFFNQALPMVHAEAPLVQVLGSDGRTVEDRLGEQLGAIRAKTRGIVHRVDADEIELEDPATGERSTLELYNSFPLNRKTRLHNFPMVKPGDQVEPGQILARSNFTDDKGTAAMGVNARVGLVPYKGYSMDDAVVISESFAKKLRSEQTYLEGMDFTEGLKPGKKHFSALFPTEYTKDQLTKLDDKGFAVAGSTLNKGDPYVLATKPRRFTSTEGQLGKLSRTMRDARQNASMTWEHDEPAEVLAAEPTSKGVSIILRTETPAGVGDKIVERQGNKNIISLILPDERMPRTVDGKPLEMLINHLGIPSRTNDSMVYDILLGKVAALTGEPVKVPLFQEPGQNWQDFVEAKLAEHGLTDKERVFDPVDQRELENPITVGNTHVLKLYHMVEDKLSGRGQGAYSVDEQPLKGGGDAAQAKRMSTLELNAMLSSGAYATMREGSTLRGAKNDEYWRLLRQGHTPKEPGTPFVWDKFRALLAGAGLRTLDLGDGTIRLGAMTDQELDKLKPARVQNGESVDPLTFQPIPGGLFDPVSFGSGRWGYMELPEPVPNPAFEKQVALLLGIRNKDLRRIIAGEITLEEAKR